MSFSSKMFPLALRDTALTVAELADAARPAVDFGTFRASCLGQVSRLREEFLALGQPDDVTRDAVYAQCALLDEAALAGLQGIARDAWEREPLQVTEFQSHDAGQALIARIEQRLAEPQPVLPLLVVFHVVLGLGFKGRYALEGSDAREALVQAIEERLHRAGMREAAGPLLVTGGKTAQWRRLTPLAWVAIACAGAGLVYVALDRWLAAAIARLPG